MPADTADRPTNAEQNVNQAGAIINRVRKLPVTRYITLYLIFGIVLSALSLWVFSEIAEELTVEGDRLTHFDTELANALHAEATPLGIQIYLVITWFGSEGVWAFGVLIGLVFLLRRDWFRLLFWAVTLIGGALLNGFMKEFFARPRPYFADPHVIEQNYSFPSAHSMMSLILYGLIAYLLWRAIHDRVTRYFVVFDAVLFIVLIGISRMTLGVHYISDVIGGFAAGGVWLGACIAAMNLIQQHGEYRQQMRQVIASSDQAQDKTAGRA